MSCGGLSPGLAMSGDRQEAARNVCIRDERNRGGGMRHLAVVLVPCFLTASLAAQEGLVPRRPADKLHHQSVSNDTPLAHLVFKFHEGTRVRLRDGVLIALERDDRDRSALAARGLTETRVDEDVAEAQRLILIEPR